MSIRTHYTSQIKPEDDEKEVVVAGWVHRIRDLGNLKFIILRDREGLIQITLKKGVTAPELIDLAENIKDEYVIAVKGVVKANKIAPKGRELLPLEIEILSRTVSNLPVSVSGKIESNLDTRLDNRVLDLRRPEVLAIFKIQSKLVEGMQDYLREDGFQQIFTPCLMGAASESGAEVFPVVYFNKSAFLRQDPQLHRQLAVISGLDRIYDLGPSWRAEPSHTPRHLCEHRGCAVELGFIRDEYEVMKVEENLVISGVRKVKEDCKEELEILGKEIEVPSSPFPELKFPQIYEILEEFGKKIPFGEDYDRESEAILAKYVKERYKSDFFFVNRFPFKVKPFYVMRVDEEPQWARSVDLIYKGLEVSSGGQREHRYEKIMEQLREKGISLVGMQWFTEHFKYGAPPHGGFNIGIERMTMQLLDLSNVREAALFPRTPERLLP
ncbi:MAG: aspartate--tRNA(Asn) ligase [Candidatus Methanomethylicia archaeon]|jgi:aspartyl-tRNA synthetase|nr:aspartate--tRNA(Asn) ligase [Candidatus Methanomethylicia archaeon]MCQ5374770.1 aspartate--tRNA(Asn) ligase [Candidatus Methanomethylicia archaeon]